MELCDECVAGRCMLCLSCSATRPLWRPRTCSLEVVSEASVLFAVEEPMRVRLPSSLLNEHRRLLARRHLHSRTPISAE